MLYAQLRLTALANKRVELEVEEMLNPHPDTRRVASVFKYLDEQIEACKANTSGEMMGLVAQMMEQTDAEMKRRMEGGD